MDVTAEIIILAIAAVTIVGTMVWAVRSPAKRPDVSPTPQPSTPPADPYAQQLQQPVRKPVSPTPVLFQPLQLPADPDLDPASAEIDPLPLYDVVCLEGNPGGKPATGDRIPFTNLVMIIGRDETNDISIEDAAPVSRHHASLAYRDGNLYLNDMNSTNGTWIGDHRVQSAELLLGQAFQIGPCTFVVIHQGQRPFTLEEEGGTLDTMSNELDDFESRIRPIAHKLGLHVIDRVGEGGAASVFRVMQDDSVMALKVLHNNEPYFREKFLDEIEAMHRLADHPKVVNIFDSGDVAGYPYILMEFMDQGSVQDLLTTEGMLPAQQTVEITGNVCEALDYAHRNGIIHRDIKPENILLNSAGEAKLADFGIAKLTESVTKTQVGVIIGTPKYLSCEQARSLPVTPKSDQYSLAIVMYEMLAGRPPFDGDPFEIITNHINDLPPSPRRFNYEVSEQHEYALHTALQKDADRRFDTIIGFAEAIGYENPSADDGTMPLFAKTISDPIATPYLTGVPGFSAVTKIPLINPTLTIGRGSLPDQPPHVSGQHAEITQQGADFFIRDLGSTNGTFVNRLQVEPGKLLKLEHGCYINLGATMVQFNLY